MAAPEDGVGRTQAGGVDTGMAQEGESFSPSRVGRTQASIPVVPRSVVLGRSRAE